MAKGEAKLAEQPAPEAKAEAKALSLSQLALKHGHTFHRLAKDGATLVPLVPAHDSPFKRTHLLADALHGWSKFERQTSEAIRLSDEDYLAALKAAEKGKTHKPASKRAEKDEA